MEEGVRKLGDPKKIFEYCEPIKKEIHSDSTNRRVYYKYLRVSLNFLIF